MKKIFLTGLLFFFIAGATNLFACEFEFELVSEKKEIYKVGDEIIVHVKVTFTHRVCPLAIADTKFKTKGLKVVGTKDWEEVSSGVYVRKLKLEVTGTKDGKIQLIGSRTCDKEGGFGSLTLKCTPVE
ncbi:MAG: hypothetical protein A2W91_05165 [Bacteroidetes bacterium GWF2_38_335]|nr:MAG: hypothetical protein A2W91_05165 [Bacteroidetes bacterium GWF2_38_335]OFY79780.1 MAG: hypothetical protein A2281_10255 [Bacteroidetes bacterium RIFOXYA12_FULL_38_20]HBS88168.1 hypothetical protein [Bacteroidales bacterium]